MVVVEPSTHVRDASQMSRMLWGAAAAAAVGLRGGVMARGCRDANTSPCYSQGAGRDATCTDNACRAVHRAVGDCPQQLAGLHHPRCLRCLCGPASHGFRQPGCKGGHYAIAHQGSAAPGVSPQNAPYIEVAHAGHSGIRPRRQQHTLLQRGQSRRRRGVGEGDGGPGAAADDAEGTVGSQR